MSSSPWPEPRPLGLPLAAVEEVGGGGDESSLPWGLLLDEVLGDAITLEDHLDWVVSSRFIEPVASKNVML
ncbi:hypothetical protein HaLaN_25935 [Haematococcus lacustris]|uniref:Uncharacterized protein n=1 Tax=Haematococcus lacustris TaxID=44745 RepID=A0A6A0A3A7_HAELA|nr:hypothetical protein HaLaN_25935 [Haematococcus lacustris]